MSANCGSLIHQSSSSNRGNRWFTRIGRQKAQPFGGSYNWENSLTGLRFQAPLSGSSDLGYSSSIIRTKTHWRNTETFLDKTRYFSRTLDADRTCLDRRNGRIHNRDIQPANHHYAMHFTQSNWLCRVNLVPGIVPYFRIKPHDNDHISNIQRFP